MKLLIVEDEAKIAGYLRKGLAEEGYVIDVATNGIDGLHMALHESYALIVLDTMLPGIDGFGLLAALRQSKQTPVIMLTARHRIEDRVRGLKAGADDYLVKPFAFSELVARIEVLLRRAAGTAPAPDALVLALADLQVDLGRRRATRAGQRIDLSAKEFQLLSLLLRRKGEVLSRTELSEHIYAEGSDRDSNTIEVFVGRLRKKLPPGSIETVRGLGYRLVDASATP